MTTQTSFEKLSSLRSRTRINLDSGRYAVALFGWRGWRRDSAIGDGITSATAALITRCDSLAEATSLAESLNDAQRGVLPGSQDVPVYAARKYCVADYLSSQNQRNGNRKCDRRIATI